MNTVARNVNSIQILGSSVNMVDIPFIVDWMADRIDRFDKERMFAAHLLVTGFHGLNQAAKDPAFFHIGQTCDLWVPDSIAPVMAARFRGMKHAVRTPGAEIMAAFFELADQRQFSSFFYGDSDPTLTALKIRLESTYPGHKVAGVFSPPFRPLTPSEEQDHIDMINAVQPDVVWVGLGLPKQDEWIYRCRGRLKAPVAAGVGAAFGFLANTVKRAPNWVCRIGLEWAYMVIRKPKRTGKRVFGDGSQFLWRLLKEEMRRDSRP